MFFKKNHQAKKATRMLAILIIVLKYNCLVYSYRHAFSRNW